MKFKLVEDSNEVRRHFSHKNNDKGSGINSVKPVKSFYAGLNYTGNLECHHIFGSHDKDDLCVAPEGFNSAFHSFVNDLIESRFSNAPNYKEDLTVLDNLEDAIIKLNKMINPSNKRTIEQWISQLNSMKNSISPSTQNVLRTTEPHVETLYRKLLNKFISGKLSHPKLDKYKGKVFYKQTLEKQLGIKFWGDNI